MSNRLRELSRNVRQLAATPAFPGDMRARAEAVGDLLDLAADWPVPRSLDLDRDIRSQLPGLCHGSGRPLCGGSFCVPPGAMPSTVCSASASARAAG